MSYDTRTIEVGEKSGYKIVGVGTSEFEALIASGQTFRFKKTYNIDEAKHSCVPSRIMNNDYKVTIALTCQLEDRTDKKTGKVYKYWYGHWRQPNYTKKVKSVYLGKKPTLDKLKAACDKLFDQFDVWK